MGVEKFHDYTGHDLSKDADCHVGQRPPRNDGDKNTTGWNTGRSLRYGAFVNVGTGDLDGPLTKNHRFRTAREVGPYMDNPSL